MKTQNIEGTYHALYYNLRDELQHKIAFPFRSVETLVLDRTISYHFISNRLSEEYDNYLRKRKRRK